MIENGKLTDRGFGLGIVLLGFIVCLIGCIYEPNAPSVIKFIGVVIAVSGLSHISHAKSS